MWCADGRVGVGWDPLRVLRAPGLSLEPGAASAGMTEAALSPPWKLNEKGAHVGCVTCPASHQMLPPCAIRTRVSPTEAHGARRRAGLSAPTGTAAAWP